jgi:hypothetical protein
LACLSATTVVSTGRLSGSCTAVTAVVSIAHQTISGSTRTTSGSTFILVAVAILTTGTAAAAGNNNSVVQGNTSNANVGCTTASTGLVATIISVTLATAIPAAWAPNAGAATAAAGLSAHINIQGLTWSNGKSAAYFAPFTAIVPSVCSALSATHVKGDRENTSRNGPSLLATGIVKSLRT